MQLNTTTDHSIRIIFHLTKAKKVVPSHVLARELNLSRRYFYRVISILRNEGIIAVEKGPNGGYSLAKSPESISIYDIIQLLEGSLKLPDSSSKPNPNTTLDTVYTFFQEFGEKSMRLLTFDKLAAHDLKDVIKIIHDFIFVEKSQLFS